MSRRRKWSMAEMAVDTHFKSNNTCVLCLEQYTQCTEDVFSGLKRFRVVPNESNDVPTSGGNAGEVNRRVKEKDNSRWSHRNPARVSLTDHHTVLLTWRHSRAVITLCFRHASAATDTLTGKSEKYFPNRSRHLVANCANVGSRPTVFRSNVATDRAKSFGVRVPRWTWRLNYYEMITMTMTSSTSIIILIIQRIHFNETQSFSRLIIRLFHIL